MVTVLATGGFDPLHSGHIEYLKAAAELGDYLVVGVNSDSWLERKKGRYFMPRSERIKIISSLECVDEVIEFNDDNGSASDAIYEVLVKNDSDIVIFANGGDRTGENCLEWNEFRGNSRVVFAFGVGGSNKKNSSSNLLERWSRRDAHYVVPEIEKVRRNWGYYRVLEENPKCRVKELVIYPLQTISMQRHFGRSEFWFVKDGSLKLRLGGYNTYSDITTMNLSKDQTYDVKVGRWHSAENPSSHKDCKVIEIQYGEFCDEGDIERAKK